MITETMGADSSAARWRGALLSVPVRVAVTVVLLGAIALLVDWSEVRAAVSDGRWGWFAAAVAVLAVALVIGGLRWHLLLGAGGLRVGRAEALRAYFIGTFSNNFLPTGFGGDAARALIVGRGGSLVAAGTTVTVDRLSAIGCLLLVAAAAAIVDPGAVPGELEALLAATLAAVALGVGAFVLVLRSSRAARAVPLRLQPAARQAKAVLVRYGAAPRVVLAALALGLVYQVLVVVQVAWLARAIRLDLPFALVAVVMPLVLVVTLFPISIAGFGVREGGFVALLATAGVSAADATVLSLLTVAAMALASLPGAAAIALPARGRPPERSLP
jgi:uncharacterized membrane protein YbhN (UPF0104 family)